jgi:catechol 2,3-dioxygenase-like lactoylglutathione lyase family enzyme
MDEPAASILGQVPVYPILLSTDLAKSRAFYGDRLGLPLLNERTERLVFQCGDGTRLIISESTIGTRDTQTQVVWRVPDIRAAIADLRGRGIRIEEYEPPDPATTDGVADMGHSWAAWFIDPSGNVLSVIQPKG